MTPAVFRNGRYEFRLALAESRIVELARMLAMQAEAMRNLALTLERSTNVEHLMPALPEVPDRAFGKGH